MCANHLLRKLHSDCPIIWVYRFHVLFCFVFHMVPIGYLYYSTYIPQGCTGAIARFLMPGVLNNRRSQPFEFPPPSLNKREQKCPHNVNFFNDVCENSKCYITICFKCPFPFYCLIRFIDSFYCHMNISIVARGQVLRPIFFQIAVWHFQQPYRKIWGLPS